MDTRLISREELENYIVGIVLFDESYLNSVSRLLSPSIFQNPQYKIIIDALLSMHKINPTNINTITLINYLKTINKLDDVGGEPELVGLQTEIPNKGTTKRLVLSINKLKGLK